MTAFMLHGTDKPAARHSIKGRSPKYPPLLVDIGIMMRSAREAWKAAVLSTIAGRVFAWFCAVKRKETLTTSPALNPVEDVILVVAPQLSEYWVFRGFQGRSLRL